MTDPTTPTPAEFWEQRYASADRVWSGRVNHALSEVVSGLAPGRALDLGCGEGGDVIWLARQGWDATGIDLSPTAIRRAQAAASETGIPADRIRFIAADLATWMGEGTYDLVTASFLHSWSAEIPRTEILRRGADLVGPGGHLLIISHAAPPPWAGVEHEHEDGKKHQFVTAQEEIDALALDPDRWETRVAELRRRQVTRPDGQSAVLDDSVVLVRRR